MSGWLSAEHRAIGELRRAERVERLPIPGAKHLGAYLRLRLHRNWGVHIHPKAKIGERVRFPHPVGIVIGAGVTVEDDVTIGQHVTIGVKSADDRSYPVIRRGARIYGGSMIIGAIEIGEDAVVGASSLVLHDVPAGAVVAGSPARPVRPSGAEQPRPASPS
jgi:serine O-acetyltransferase